MFLLLAQFLIYSFYRKYRLCKLKMNYSVKQFFFTTMPSSPCVLVKSVCFGSEAMEDEAWMVSAFKLKSASIAKIIPVVVDVYFVTIVASGHVLLKKIGPKLWL